MKNAKFYLLFGTLCLLSIIINLVHPNSLIFVALFGILLCVFLFSEIKRNWTTNKNIVYLYIFFMILIVGFPIFLLSIPR